MKEHVRYGSFIHAKACYRCGWVAPNIATATSLCGHCGHNTVVYGEGRIAFKTVRHAWYKKPVVTRNFVFTSTRNIDANRYLGIGTVPELASVERKDWVNPHRVEASHVRPHRS